MTLQITDTNFTPVNENGFENTGSCLQFRYNQDTQFRRLYSVKEGTWKWDLGEDFKVPEGWTLMAVGSRLGHYAYILIRKVGTVLTQCTGGCDRGLRHRFCFIQEMQAGEISLATADAGYLVEDYWHHN